ncbi:MAG TPA: hypothetical protein VKT73_13035 [Xanthobacteraceae bacterium]|nr:hypothetical protein [Xanthobacteraceae bacterium]
MAKKPYTKKQLDEFDYLTWMASSSDQMDRIRARLEMPRFIEKHGKEKCELMFAELKRQDAARRKGRK